MGAVHRFITFRPVLTTALYADSVLLALHLLFDLWNAPPGHCSQEYAKRFGIEDINHPRNGMIWYALALACVVLALHVAAVAASLPGIWAQVAAPRVRQLSSLRASGRCSPHSLPPACRHRCDFIEHAYELWVSGYTG